MNTAIFTKKIDTNGEEYYDVTIVGTLLITAGTLYGDPAETTPQGMNNCKALIDGILSAAFSGGFKQGDILQTLLSRNVVDRRTVNLAQAACDAAGAEAIDKVLVSLGLQSRLKNGDSDQLHDTR